MINKYDVITFGSLTQDIMFYTDDAVLIKNPKDLLRQELIAFEYGAKIRSEQVSFAFGGGGSNTAVSFSMMGLKVAVVGRTGQDRFGDEYFRNFTNHKVDTSLIERDSNKGSGFSFIINYGDFNEHVIFSYRGANNNFDATNSKFKIRNSKWYYVAALSQNNLSKNLDYIFKIAEAKKIKIAWNPGVSELKRGYSWLKKYLKNTHTFIVNKDEAIEICASAKVKTTSINKLLKTLYKYGPEIVAISHGHLGAYLYDGEKVYYHKALKVKSVNTTGAGDAFASSIVAGLIIFKGDLEKSLKLAIIRSNFVIKKIGAQVGLLNKKDSLKLLK